jgi:hypothetical protein
MRETISNRLVRGFQAQYQRSLVATELANCGRSMRFIDRAFVKRVRLPMKKPA